MNIRIMRELKMLEKMIVDNDNTIINNNLNFFTNSLDNKSLEKEK